MAFKHASRQTRQQAFAMYCHEIPMTRIAEANNVAISTVSKWASQENWEEKRKQVFQYYKDHASKSSKERRRQILSAMLGLSSQGLVENPEGFKKKVKPLDIVKMLEFDRLEEGESTQNIAVAVKNVNPLEALMNELDRERRKKLGAPVNGKPGEAGGGNVSEREEHATDSDGIPSETA